MNLEWSLKELYDSFHCEAYKADLNRFSAATQELNEICKKTFSSYENSLEKIENYLEKMIEINVLYIKLNRFADLNISINSSDADAVANMGIVNKIVAENTPAKIMFKNYVVNHMGLEEDIIKSKLIKEHEFYIKEIIEKSRYQLSDNEEILAAKMILTGSDSWFGLQNMVASQAIVELEENGEIVRVPATGVQNLPYTDDKEVKRKRFKAEIEAYDKYKNISAYAVNSIKGEVIALNKLRGIPSVLDKTLINARLDRKALDALISTIEKNLPKLRKYLKIKGKYLGYENGIPYYDQSAPVGKSNKIYTEEDSREMILEAFEKFSPELMEYAKQAYDNSWIDFRPKPGKSGGAFCLSIYSIGESRIMTNFTGNLSSINTIAHELGHGFHAKQMLNESILNTTYYAPISETASTFCENVMRSHLLSKITEEEKLTFLDSVLYNQTRLTIDILARYYFEVEYVKIREERELSADEINQLMADAQLKSYGDSLDPEYLNPYMWLNKVHYFYAESNFYNFPYAFGFLLSMGLYGKFEEEGSSFVEKYKSFLRNTGKMRIVELLQTIGIDVTDADFWQGSVDKITALIDEYEKLLNADK